MRIGFDVGPITHTRTGVGQYCYYLLKHLLERDQDSEYVGFASGLESLDLNEFSPRLRHRQLRIPTRALFRAWDYLSRPKVDAFLGGLDIYHATNFVVPPVRRARRVVTIHDITFLAVPELCSPKITDYFAGHVASYVKDADAIMVHSQATKDDLKTHLDVEPDRVTVAWPGVDPGLGPVDREDAADVLRREYRIDRPFILCVGTLEARKNMVAAVRAFATLSDAPHMLVLVGKLGWNSEPVFQAIDELGLRGRVRHLGFVPNHRDLSYFYSAATALLYPSYYEGFGLPVAEAMACGCPVVASNASSIPEVVGDAALTASPDDADAHAEHLNTVVTDEAVAERMRLSGLERAKAFSWSECAGTTLSVYRKVAA